MSLRILDGIGEIAEGYDGFILDVWGVLHDGIRPFPGVVDALAHLRRAGKRIVVLSNAPRRAAPVAERLAEIGIAAASYDALHSSGEEVWRHLSRRDDPFYAALGKRYYHIGPAKDDGVGAGLDFARVEAVGDADFILNTGPWGWEATIAGYEPMLREAQQRDLPMVCANADLVVVHQGRRMFCAGALAERYEALGGRVRWHGKPYASVYQTCFELLGIADPRRVLAVGDSLRTDIAGAAGAGIASVFVTGGIHGEELGLRPGERPEAAQLAAAFAAAPARPDYAMAHLRW